MKAYGREEVCVHIFLTMTAHSDEWLAPHPDWFIHFYHFWWETELPFLQYWFQSREQVNITYRRVWRNATVLLHGSLLRNPWPKRTSVLGHCCEGETNCWFSTFLLTPSLQQWRMSMNFFIPSFTIYLIQQLP